VVDRRRPGLVLFNIFHHATHNTGICVVPMFVVFNITGLLGTFSEHHWGTLLEQPARPRLVLQQSRFLLDSAPERAQPRIKRIAAWAVWWLRFLGYHVPGRRRVWSVTPNSSGVRRARRRSRSCADTTTWPSTSHASRRTR
jgi:hypothetical protein